MKERLKADYEEYSMDATKDTILALKEGDMMAEAKKEGDMMAEAKKIALEAIDDWKQEEKLDLIKEFKKWLEEQGITLDKKERLKTNYEKHFMNTTKDTILALKKSNNVKEAKDFALKTIDDWKQEDKHELVEKFKKWLEEQGIILDKVE